MVVTNSDKEKEKRSLYYYKNRERIIKRQRDYDRTHKEIKYAYDKKRRKLKDYNKKKYYQHYSQKNHFPILLEKYGGCQIDGSKDKLEIHHKRYTKKLKDCMLVCQKCHKKLHRKIYK